MDKSCIICNSPSVPYFGKTFASSGLSTVAYFRCTNCGFVHSETHAAMSVSEWKALNSAYHKGYQSVEHNPDDPRWLDRIESQASVISGYAQLGLIPTAPHWLDYAAGGCQLSASLSAKSNLTPLNFDRYMRAPEP